jgi:2-iminobutanoate/2-iminopropanoate deaminase
MKAVLEAEKLSMADVVKTTVFMKNIENFARMNEVYASYFPAPHPARSTVEVARLPRDVEVEIEAVALAHD